MAGTEVTVIVTLTFADEVNDHQQLAQNVVDALESQLNTEQGLAPENDETYTKGILAQVIDSFSLFSCPKAGAYWGHPPSRKLGDFDNLSDADRYRVASGR